MVKCNQLMNIPMQNINKRIGTVTAEDLMIFLKAFDEYLKENN